MKTLLCCIGRLENQYIREYVEYYKDLGVTNICLYDNNHNGEEHFEDVIGDYIDEGFVILKNCRNLLGYQMRSYQMCYKEYKNLYDWILFFDCDEFLTFTDPNINNIEQMLNDSRFDNFDMIHVNWMIYTDNGMIYNNHKPVLERFTSPKEPLDYIIPESGKCLNYLCKSIIRGGLEKVTFLNSHTPNNITNCCDSNGQPVDGKSRRCKCVFDNMYLKHFRSKTIEEFLSKIERGYPDRVCEPLHPLYEDMLKLVFFVDNNPTTEKLNYIKDTIGLDLFEYYKNRI